MKKFTATILTIAVLFSCGKSNNPKLSSRYEDYYPELNKYYSDKPLGAIIKNGNTIFRLFAPQAAEVKLVLFETYDASKGDEYIMKVDADGVWEYKISGELYGTYYGYHITGQHQKSDMVNPSIIIADPYSKAVVTQNNFHHPGKSLIISDEYDWEGDTWMTTPLKDLIIYEMHVRDMTAHPSSGVNAKGTYHGLIEKGRTGGLSYLLDLGINAIELLPIQDFGNIEIPYEDNSTSVYNTWNPYERNHWGYMTSYFFAPESYYAGNGNMQKNQYCGIHGQQVKEFKDLVQQFHKNGIAVIMDVVYNHVSQYDQNPFKYIDKKYYFRLDSNDNFLSKSGCGNDFKTERPMARRLIIESVKYWLTQYHIDGFRFDLANLIDEKTCDEILKEARKINPHVYIIAEPWGDGYNPAWFSEHGWAAWNDKFRNAVKGQNPHDNPGFIFSKWERENSSQTISRYILGSVIIAGGQFQKSEHSINYLESHDDFTMGDFIRIGTGEMQENDRITNIIKHVKLSARQLKLNKLAALFLFTSQGAVMIHQGQEFARSKIIAQSSVPDTNWGRIDHNSYEKDNETNYINYFHKELNEDLYQYYKGLIALRKAHPAFRNSKQEDIHFLPCNNEFGLGFYIAKKTSGDTNDFLVLVNGHPVDKALFILPDGTWGLVANSRTAGTEVFQEGISGKIKVAPASGMILLN